MARAKLSREEVLARKPCVPSWCRCPYTHESWQRQVVELAQMLGWDHLSVRRSIGAQGKWVTTTNRIGWPDWFGWHSRHGFAAIEIKVGRDGHDKRADDQRRVLVELEAAGARVLMAYPHDLNAVTALLRGTATGVH